MSQSQFNRRRPEEPPRKPLVGPEAISALLLPFLIVLVTLDFSTYQDLMTLHRHKVELVIENAETGKPLGEAARRAIFIDSIHHDLADVAATDPVAAQVLSDFFPSSATVPANPGR